MYRTVLLLRSKHHGVAQYVCTYSCARGVRVERVPAAGARQGGSEESQNWHLDELNLNPMGWAHRSSHNTSEGFMLTYKHQFIISSSPMHLVVQFHQELAPHHHKRAGEQQGYQQVVSDQQLRPSGAPQARAHAHPAAERVLVVPVRARVDRARPRARPRRPSAPWRRAKIQP